MRILNWPRVLSASLELLKIVTAVSGPCSVIFPAMSSPVAIAHNSASIISLFMPRKILLFFQLSSRSLSFQHTAAAAFPWLSLDPSTYNSWPIRCFFASSTAFFFFSITISLKPALGPRLRTGFTPYVGSKALLLATR